MTKKEMAKIIINLLADCENNYIVYGHDEKEARKLACLDAGITARQYDAITKLIEE